MLFRSIILAGTAALLGAGPAWAQTITENVNNTGIPRNAPALGLSNIYGLNPCSAGTSVGVTTPLFGIGGAVSTIDKECETRNNAAVVITGLKDDSLAREILCEIKDIRDAAIRVGKPCLRDQAAPGVASVASDSAAPKVASVAPGSVAPKAASVIPIRPASAEAAAEPIKPLAASGVIRADAPVFCRVKDLDIGLYPECTTAQAPRVPEAAVVPRASPALSQRAPSQARQQVAAPVPADNATPDAGSEVLLKNPSWAESVSYTPPRVSGGKPARMIGRAVAMPPAALPVAASPPSDRVARLLQRGAAMVAAGDITEARLFYERAAAAGSGQAAIEMGKTYDPGFLASIKAIGIRPDPATADKWYRRALAFGDAKVASVSHIASW
jgi:hypothetical protein